MNDEIAAGTLSESHSQAWRDGPLVSRYAESGKQSGDE